MYVAIAICYCTYRCLDFEGCVVANSPLVIYYISCHDVADSVCDGIVWAASAY